MQKKHLPFQLDIFSHPDCNCRFRNHTGSATKRVAKWVTDLKQIGSYRRSGISPCPEDGIDYVIVKFIIHGYALFVKPIAPLC